MINSWWSQPNQPPTKWVGPPFLPSFLWLVGLQNKEKTEACWVCIRRLPESYLPPLSEVCPLDSVCFGVLYSQWQFHPSKEDNLHLTRITRTTRPFRSHGCHRRCLRVVSSRQTHFTQSTTMVLFFSEKLSNPNFLGLRTKSTIQLKLKI